MKWIWKHKIFSVLILLSLLISGYAIWFVFIFTGRIDD